MMLLNDLLQENGFATLQAGEASEAMRLAREHRPDLIVMDIQLPRVSGLEVIRWLRRDDALRGIPIVAVTAFAMPGDERVMRSAGCVDYLPKPISTRHFLDVEIGRAHVCTPLHNAHPVCRLPLVKTNN